MLPETCIFLFCFLICVPSLIKAATSLNLTLPNQHPNPEAVAQEVQRSVNVSISRRDLLSTSMNDQSQCLTGNPIDDCWRCDSNWANNRQRLADCAIGFGQGALGGKGGQIYVVNDSSDRDTVNPTPGTLRHAVIQDEPLWIVFQSNMVIKLKHELIINSYKTIDGRGANVQITGNGCLTLQYVSNVIIHNVHIYDCRPSGDTNIRSSPTHFGYRSKSDGDGISIFGSRNIWIDHCALSHCTDGLVDAIMGSTAITISNSYFSYHDEVMLLGHDDKYLPDSGMQVTIAFNYFGEGLVQRMPRCRRGYIHVVNNDITEWKMYAIGGSGNPTINSQGNRYTAPSDPSAKEVTKRCDTDEGQWSNWNWRTDGDVMVNGAFFVPSGGGFSTQYAKASSVEPKSSVLIDRLTINAGVLGGPRYTLPYLLLLYVPLQLKNISHFNCLKISFAFIYLGFDKRTGALCRGSRLSHHSKTLFYLYKILNFSPCLSPIF
ncbi:probable pectate lyase 5 isoform X1 [Olea europaea subsp. europaea]|uniref:Pectate lyase n=1 Tax=Olea europaea subsp. europaea TaxID=158383 RepID=A0A8S0V750_OLEEU|nr:probable pectate lyase 5 isoform X1 [Olea europaea subsp. europaea]